MASRTRGMELLRTEIGFIRVLTPTRLKHFLPDYKFEMELWSDLGRSMGVSAAIPVQDAEFASFQGVRQISMFRACTDKVKFLAALRGGYKAQRWDVIGLREFLRPGEIGTIWGEHPTVEGRRVLASSLDGFVRFYNVYWDLDFMPAIRPLIGLLDNTSDRLGWYFDIFIRAEVELMLSHFFQDVFKYAKSLYFPAQAMGTRGAVVELLQCYVVALVSRIDGWEIFPHHMFFSREGPFSQIVQESIPGARLSSLPMIQRPTMTGSAVGPVTGLCPWSLADHFNLKTSAGMAMKCNRGAQLCPLAHPPLELVTQTQATAAAMTFRDGNPTRTALLESIRKKWR